MMGLGIRLTDQSVQGGWSRRRGVPTARDRGTEKRSGCEALARWTTSSYRLKNSLKLCQLALACILATTAAK
jgi:hypothetical protein